MRPRRQRNQHIEVQLAQLLRLKSVVLPHPRQNLSRLNPVALRRRQNLQVFPLLSYAKEFSYMVK
jgi:hypothetical protein